MRVKIASSGTKTGRILILLVAFLLVAGLLPASARHGSSSGRTSSAGKKQALPTGRSKAKLKSKSKLKKSVSIRSRSSKRTLGTGKKSHSIAHRKQRYGGSRLSAAGRHQRISGRPAKISRQHQRVYSRAVAQLGEAPVDTQVEPRRRNYALLSQAYSLYDRGAAQRLSGDFGESVENLSRAYAILEQARSHQKDNNPSTLEAMVLFELAQAAESDGDLTLARDSYSRCLIASPRFAEAYLRVCDLLARQGNLPLALKFAADGVANCPEDVRILQLNEMLSGRSLNKAEQ